MAPPIGGLKVSKELKTLSERPGYLSVDDGGQRLRELYARDFKPFESKKLCTFGQSCYYGSDRGVKLQIERGDAPDLETTTTAYRWSWVSLVILGSQRCRAVRPTDHHTGPIFGNPDHEATLRYLISKGAPLQLQDIAGYTALHHATMTLSVPHMARILLEAGADPNALDKCGSPALSAASISRQLDAVDVLLEFGARLDISDADGFCIGRNYSNCGPQVTAITRKWIRKREGKSAPLEGKACDYCGKDAEHGVKLALCSRCKLARYDSKECQKNHWKVHKLTCRAPDIENTLTFKPYYDARIGMALRSKADIALESMGVSTRTAKDLLNNTSPKIEKPKFRMPIGPDDKEASRMVVKIQIPLETTRPRLHEMYADCLVYNEKRDFLCLLKKKDNGVNFDTLVRIVKEKAVGGLMAYFRAELKSEDELEIRVDDVLAEQGF